MQMPHSGGFRWPLWGHCYALRLYVPWRASPLRCYAVRLFQSFGKQLVQIIGHDVEIMAVLPGCFFHTGNDHFTRRVRQQICKGSRRISSTCSSSFSTFIWQPSQSGPRFCIAGDHVPISIPAGRVGGIRFKHSLAALDKFIKQLDAVSGRFIISLGIGGNAAVTVAVVDSRTQQRGVVLVTLT